MKLFLRVILFYLWAKKRPQIEKMEYLAAAGKTASKLATT